MTEQDEKVVEFGCEVLEGFYEAVDITTPEKKKGLYEAIFMLETYMERDYNVLFENKLAHSHRKLDS